MSRCTYTALVLSLAAALGAPAAIASQALAQRYACAACHAPDRKLVGPSWEDIRNRYGSSAQALDELMAKTQAGGSGVWGSTPMPAQKQVPPKDLEAIIGWMLQRPAAQ